MLQVEVWRGVGGEASQGGAARGNVGGLGWGGG